MTAGSRGDVAPYTGLGHGIACAGHEVTLVTHRRFEPLARSAGMGFHTLPMDPYAELHSERGLALHRSATGAGKLARMLHMAREHAGPVAEELLKAGQESDMLLLGGTVAPLGQVVAEGLALPALGVYLQPLAPTREFPPPVLGVRSWGAAGNRQAAHLVNASLDLVFAAAVKDLRARLALPPAGPRAVRRAREACEWPVQHGFSPQVVPRPRDWRPGLDVAGYWWPYDPPGSELPRPLADFLAAGPPPVFVGLGSATVPDPDRLSRTVVTALRAAGLRGVIQSGWAGLAAEGDDMLTVGELPHAAVFPHMAAVVHHAGAGTTAAALRAGVPAVPVPIQFDASFWASRLIALGVAPRSVPLRGLTAGALATALTRAVSLPAYRDRARSLASRLRAEDGVAPVAAAVAAAATAG
ncbi:glycosyltransferase [Streptomyces sp. HNM0663]|uniref:Glycosyltransferase n=1 Tax=Streptomyces chengmaiensis TaxID=3040919 RepID=A0ABT6HNS4_9ACTN|nr:glycosyltransferase [Streptomyces chengmaiensis]MDH2390260.1 glycosyltransferase [Streptomyces chengmaiensis]